MTKTIKRATLPASVIWAALFWGFSPLILMFCTEMAYIHEAVSQDAYLETLWLPDLLRFPGLILCKIIRYEPLFWVPHSQGSVFWKHLLIYVLTNCLGWLLVCVAVYKITHVAMQRRWITRNSPRPTN